MAVEVKSYQFKVQRCLYLHAITYKMPVVESCVYLHVTICMMSVATKNVYFVILNKRYSTSLSNHLIFVNVGCLPNFSFLGNVEVRYLWLETTTTTNRF